MNLITDKEFMKKISLLIIVFLVINVAFGQQESAFDKGEWFKFKMSYSGWMKAGEATLEVFEDMIGDKSVFHVVGNGRTTGAVGWFFKVRDRYESYFDKEKLIPFRFVRDINEGGHTKNIEIIFDQDKNKAQIFNKKHNKNSVVDIEPNVQDMVSMFYYLRNNLDVSDLKVNDEIQTTMFFDYENYGFKIKYLGVETIRTSFGKIKCFKFRPYVMAGRVFKEEESLTLWVSADRNKIPIRIKADLAIGSLRADLDAFKGLKHQFKVQF